MADHTSYQTLAPSRADDKAQERYEEDLATKEEDIWVSFKNVNDAELFIDENIADPHILLAQIFQAMALNGFAEIEGLINKHIETAAKAKMEERL